jgi:hypothetical protein
MVTSYVNVLSRWYSRSIYRVDLIREADRWSGLLTLCLPFTCYRATVKPCCADLVLTMTDELDGMMFSAVLRY